MSAPRSRNTAKRKRQRIAAPVDCPKEAQPVQATSRMKFVANQKDHCAEEFSIPSADNCSSPKAPTLPSPVNCGIPRTSSLTIADNSISHRVLDASSLQPFNHLNTAIQLYKPVSVFASPVLNWVNCTNDYTRFAVINSLPSAMIDTSSVVFQTPLPYHAPDADDTTRNTQYCELSDEIRHGLALLSQFINEQIDKKNKINQQLDSFEFALRAVNDKATILNRDAMTLNENLNASDESIDDFILKTKEQHLEAVSASNVLQPRSKKFGGSENEKFFYNAIISMEKRMNQLTEKVSMLEQTVSSVEANASFYPQCIGIILNYQSQTFVSLAGRVADNHQEVAYLLESHRSNN